MKTIEKRCVEKDQQVREVNEELRVTKISLSTKEGASLTVELHYSDNHNLMQSS